MIRKRKKGKLFPENIAWFLSNPKPRSRILNPTFSLSKVQSRPDAQSYVQRASHWIRTWRHICRDRWRHWVWRALLKANPSRLRHALCIAIGADSQGFDENKSSALSVSEDSVELVVGQKFAHRGEVFIANFKSVGAHWFHEKVPILHVGFQRKGVISRLKQTCYPFRRFTLQPQPLHFRDWLCYNIQ